MTQAPGQAVEDMQRIVDTHKEDIARRAPIGRDPIGEPVNRQRETKDIPESPTAAAEGYLAKLTRWDSMLDLGAPGKRALRKAIRAESATIRRALLLANVLGESAPMGKDR